MRLFIVFILIGFLLSIPVSARIINVPNEYSSIQAGIDASADGDTVEVSPGTFSGRVNFLGHRILLTSELGPDSTIITTIPDSLPMIRFYTGEDSTTILRGFTIRGGTGIAIGCLYSGPIIESNIIEDNTNHGHYSENFDGAAIYTTQSYCIIRDNIIRNNYSPGAGAAISISNSSGIKIIGNRIMSNNCATIGGGIFMISSSNCVIQNNLIAGNHAVMGGGGIWFTWGGNNLIINNTIDSNYTDPGIYASGIMLLNTDFNVLKNNIITNNYPNYGIRKSWGIPFSDTLVYSDLFGNLPADADSVSPGTGCISLDPLYIDRSGGNYKLSTSSPCIDAGDPSSPLDDDETRVDMGAFSTYRRTITATSGAGGLIVPSGTVIVSDSADQTFTITPNTGYHIADVLVDDVSQGPITTYTFTDVIANHTIAASFAINIFTIVASAGLNGSIVPSGNVVIDYGRDTTFTITPNTGYHIVDVLVDGVSMGAVPSYTFTNVIANHTIAASFAVNTFTIVASAGPNGSIVPSGNVVIDYGRDTTFTITPNTGYHVADVLVDGISVGAVPSYTFTSVIANHTIMASFAVTAFTITATAGPNGMILPSGIVYVDFGSDQTFTITPNAGYHVADVLVDGVSVGAVPSYTFTNIIANHTIDASFAINTYLITATAGPNGIISPAGIIIINYGSDTTFAITANDGYHIEDVLVDNESVGQVSSYTFRNVTSDHTIDAQFAYGVAPVITSRPPSEGDINIPYAYDVEATGTPPPSFQLIVFPDQMEIDSLTGVITWVPVEIGDYEVTVAASNFLGSYQQNFIIHVSTCSYVVGDINNNGALNGVDIVFAVNYFKGSGPNPPYSCECTPGNEWFVAGDMNSDCTFNGIDIVYCVNYFKGRNHGPIPCPDCPPNQGGASIGKNVAPPLGRNAKPESSR